MHGGGHARHQLTGRPRRAPRMRKSPVLRPTRRTESPNEHDREHDTMEAERINSIRNQLADLSARVVELRRYL